MRPLFDDGRSALRSQPLCPKGLPVEAKEERKAMWPISKHGISQRNAWLGFSVLKYLSYSLDPACCKGRRTCARLLTTAQDTDAPCHNSWQDTETRKGCLQRELKMDGRNEAWCFYRESIGREDHPDETEERALHSRNRLANLPGFLLSISQPAWGCCSFSTDGPRGIQYGCADYHSRAVHSAQCTLREALGPYYGTTSSFVMV